MILRPLKSTLFPYTTLFRSGRACDHYRRTRTKFNGEINEKGNVMMTQLLQITPPDMSVALYFIVFVIAAILIVILRSEEHTSELQSLRHLVCRLLLEKNKIH